MLWIKPASTCGALTVGWPCSSLAVAFFLDIAAFTVGFLIYLVEEKTRRNSCFED